MDKSGVFIKVIKSIVHKKSANSSFYTIFSKGKKGIVPIVVASFLLLIGVTAYLYLSGWLTTHTSEVISEKFYEPSFDKGSIEFVQIKREEGVDYLYVRNFNSEDFLIQNVSINGEICTVGSGNVYIAKNDITKVNITCPSPSFDVVNDIYISTASGVVSSKIKLVRDITSSNYTASIALSSSCATGTRLFGMAGVNNSHAEIATSTVHDFSYCLSHLNIPIGTSCTGEFSKRLFYLGNDSNSHVFITNTIAYEPTPGYYDWKEVCISTTSTNIDILVQDSNPGSDYEAIFSIDDDDVYGGVLGDFNSYPTKFWLKFE